MSKQIEVRRLDVDEIGSNEEGEAAMEFDNRSRSHPSAVSQDRRSPRSQRSPKHNSRFSDSHKSAKKPKLPPEIEA